MTTVIALQESQRKTHISLKNFIRLQFFIQKYFIAISSRVPMETQADDTSDKIAVKTHKEQHYQEPQ